MNRHVTVYLIHIPINFQAAIEVGIPTLVLGSGMIVCLHGPMHEWEVHESLPTNYARLTATAQT